MRERYYLEDRVKVPFKDSLKPLPVVEVMIESDFTPDEVNQLRGRGVEFPLEVKGAPEKIYPYVTGEGYKGR